ncbi:MAG: RluA family pseudouridine synthase [Butyrivibrio sp.]|nr:RluA family pseudouridine synthase [Butyrivibrio sp.]
MKEFFIGSNEAGKRFDKYLFIILSNSSSGFIHKMLRKKNITLNDKTAEGNEKLNIGDSVKFYLSDETFEKFADPKVLKLISTENKPQETIKESLVEDTDLTYAFKEITLKYNPEVIYEDDNVLFVNKPAGLLSQKAQPRDISINEWLVGYLLEKGSIDQKQLVTFKPSICNRLDRNTSGIVICSKSLPGAQKMNEMLKERTLHKYYRTIVKGIIEKEETFDGYLYKDEKNNKVEILPFEKEGSFHIVTRYIPIKHNKNMNLTYIEVELITGKSHQIRAHLSSMGHPLIGDTKYGSIKFNTRFKKEYGLKYQLLHGYRLEFPEMEPLFADLSGKKIIAKLPEVFNRILEDNDLN